MISILSDFGLEDTYVAAMKAVIHSIAPAETILDLTHAVPPGDILRGALELWRVAPVLPSGTVLLGVVDPGVGTARRAIAFRSSDFICVGPDNGLFSYLIDQQAIETAVELKNPDYSSGLFSTTFHGRDIFAPAAAHLATGVPLSDLGPSLDSLARLPQPRLHVVDRELVQGEVLFADHFGNLVTSIGALSLRGTTLHLDPWLGNSDAITHENANPFIQLPDGSTIALSETFDDGPDDGLTAYIGSSGLLEIAVNRGSASKKTGWTRGQPVELKIQG